MDFKKLQKVSDYEWRVNPYGRMLVPVKIFAGEDLVRGMDEKVYEQAVNVAALPGIVKASYVMPDAHWGYGFCIGGVGAFDANKGGVISAGGVGFDISCGVRTLRTGLKHADIESKKNLLADTLARATPAGVGSTGKIHLSMTEMDDMLVGGAQWAIDQGYGLKHDLERIEEHGMMRGAKPAAVSEHARKRQQDEVGTLGSGNHYCEVQRVEKIFDRKIATAFGIAEEDIVISIHCGSRGLGHQIGTDYLKKMVMAAPSFGIQLPERELACAPIKSPLGQDYLGAMRAGINCALANRQILTHLIRTALDKSGLKANVQLLYDVSHNTCKEEMHEINGEKVKLFVHRKGATRSFGPGDPTLPDDLKDAGQPVIIGGTMGTASYILAGAPQSLSKALGSSCHGAGRSMSRHEATKHYQGREVVRTLASQGILVRSPSFRGVAEEAPGAYKDVEAVVDSAHEAGLSLKVARLVPLIVVKG